MSLQQLSTHSTLISVLISPHFREMSTFCSRCLKDSTYDAKDRFDEDVIITQSHANAVGTVYRSRHHTDAAEGDSRFLLYLRWCVENR